MFRTPFVFIVKQKGVAATAIGVAATAIGVAALAKGVAATAKP